MVSALLLDKSTPAQAFFATLQSGEIIMSADVIAELNDVLGREKFNRYVTAEERERFLRSLLGEATLIETERKIQVCRDPKDDRFLELAVNGGADCIVSGDDDLLALGSFRDAEVLAPGSFLDALSKSQTEQSEKRLGEKVALSD